MLIPCWPARKTAQGLITIICAGLFVAACSFSPAGTASRSADQEHNGASAEERDVPPPPLNDADLSELQSESELLTCPAPGTTVQLGFDHAFTINQGEASFTYFLHHGWLVLTAGETGGALASTNPATLKASVEGKMNAECSITGEGSMLATASGTCMDGIVHLVIQENWQAMQAVMECVDEDGETDTVPFDIPALGMMTHSGPGGAGELFLLVDDADGYLTMRPFGYGTGYHTWTLNAAGIPLVPLAP